jgi:hypothetical protein
MNNPTNNEVFKLSFLVLLAVLMLAGCKEKEVWPKESYEMLNQRSIKLVNYSGWSPFSFKEDPDKVVFLTEKVWQEAPKTPKNKLPYEMYLISRSHTRLTLI